MGVPMSEDTLKDDFPEAVQNEDALRRLRGGRMGQFTRFVMF
jgi:hypothetical protein